MQRPSPLHASARGFRRLVALAFAAGLSIAASGTAHADMSELDDCRTPQYVVFSSAGNGSDVTRTVFHRGASAPVVLGRNPEGDRNHAPGHLQNCTEGNNGNPGQVQWLVFKLYARNWFGTPNEDHLAVAMRAEFRNLTLPGSESYDARGFIFHRYYGGILGERYALNVPGVQQQVESLGAAADPGFFGNDVVYQIEAHATRNGVAYRATNTATGQTTGWRYHGQLPGDADTLGTGLGFVVLCPTPGAANCGLSPGFNVYFWDISTGWFTP
jgi:hypothetical protein